MTLRSMRTHMLHTSYRHFNPNPNPSPIPNPNPNPNPKTSTFLFIVRSISPLPPTPRKIIFNFFLEMTQMTFS